MAHALNYAVNCSTLFTELPLLQRPAAARAAGFDAVEFWWPFDTPQPADADVQEFCAAIEDAGVQLVNLNFYAGDMAAGHRGVLSWPDYASDFMDSTQIAVDIGIRLGCGMFNALYGTPPAGVHPEEQDRTARISLSYASGAAARTRGKVLLEPLSGVPGYPIRTAANAAAACKLSSVRNVRILADLYHLSENGEDLDAVIADYAGQIAHVQIADAPGRGTPGTGTLDLQRYLDALETAGYDGWVSLEYIPDGPTAQSLDWLPMQRRGRQGG